MQPVEEEGVSVMWPKSILVFALALLTLSCISRRVDLPPLIPPTREASLSELVDIINQRGDISTFISRAELQFITREQAEQGKGRRYRSGQGRLLLARPGHILLTIEAPLLSANIADMASDGDRFQLLIYPEEYRALIFGSNNKSYAAEARKLDSDPELAKAGPLVNIRPQHFTGAFLFESIDEENAHYHEERPLEDDDRPNAEKDQKVIRSYYVVSDTRRGELAPRWKYWFDRTRDMTLTRLQQFDSKGLLVGDITYSNYLPPEPATGVRFPSEITIDRPYEDYALRISLKPDSIQLNREIPPTAFTLEPPPEWKDSLRRVDLDKKNR
jgi:hypothetical protein